MKNFLVEKKVVFLKCTKYIYNKRWNEFIENDVKSIHQILVNNKNELLQRFSTLPGAYKTQMINAVEHLCDLNSHDFIIKPKTSFVFITEDDEDTSEEKNDNANQMNDSNKSTYNIDSSKNITNENTHDPNEETLDTNEHIKMNLPSSRTQELLQTANEQQRSVANFFRQYLALLMKYEDSRHRSEQNMPKPLPFHIVVNGLAGSGKSYLISIIEQMLTDFCISESAIRNRPRRNKGLLKMAHTGKAALNIHGWTIHTALGMVNITFFKF